MFSFNNVASCINKKKLISITCNSCLRLYEFVNLTCRLDRAEKVVDEVMGATMQMQQSLGKLEQQCQELQNSLETATIMSDELR